MNHDDLARAALEDAIARSGGVVALSNRLQVNQPVVSNWRIRGKAAAASVLAIESATGVSRHDLRPDIFGPAPTSKAAA